MPQSKPSLLSTVFFNLFFVLLFVLVLLWSLITAYGYQIDPIKRQVVESGILNLQTITSNAAITLDNNLLTQKTPCTINNLAIKSHLITLNRDGYFPWNKKIEIQRELITEVGQVKLVPKNLDENMVTYGSADFFAPSNTGKVAIFSKSKIVIYDPEAKIISSTQAPRTDISSLFWQNEKLYAKQSTGRIWELRSDNVWQYSTIQIANSLNNLVSPDRKQELGLENNEIWIIDLEENTKKLFSRFSADVDWVDWYSNTQIIYGVAGQVKISDLDRVNSYDLTKYNPKNNLVFLNHTLYYFEDDILKSIKLSDPQVGFLGIF